MSNFIFILKVVGTIFLTFLLLSIMLHPMDPHYLVLERFLTGFGHFLVRNFPLISWNADSWVPGLGAFLISWFFIHRWLSRWAKRTNRPWSLMTSFCMVSLVPVLFVISFIVPGILLQWDALRDVHWVEIHR